MSQPHPSGAGQPAAGLTAAAAGLLREALRSTSGLPSDGALRAALRQLTDHARRDGLRAEQVVMLLKQEWAALPEAQDLPPGVRRTETLGRVVTLCIEEYYAVRPPPDG